MISSNTKALPRRCAVLGDPIAHSKSPYLHSQFALQTGIALQYDKVRLNADEFQPWVKDFFAEGGVGLNITLPHKERAVALADVVRPRAKMAGAANTLGVDEHGLIWADNTDGIGLVNDLQRLGVALKDKKVLLAGAGGAAMGLLPALLAANVAHIALLNRTRERAAQIVNLCQHSAIQLYSEALPLPDMLISTVSTGLAELLQEQKTLSAPSVAYDLNYGTRAEAFIELMQKWPVPLVFTGAGMLIEQAAESFYLWHGVRPDTAPLHAQGLPD